MPLLEIDNLGKAFGGVQAVRTCSFGVQTGRITALIGPNGAGKTTVFHLISGFFPADSGRILFEGNDLTRLPAWKRGRMGLSRTFQLSRLFKNLTVEENLLLALREDDHRFWCMFFRGRRGDGAERKAVADMMLFVGLEKDPKTPVTDLSYGQQKLFDLTRVLLHPHRLLMLDEPIAGVNPVLRDRFKVLLKQLKGKGETILLIEHDMDFVRAVADEVIVMDQGTVLASGTPAVVLKDPRVLEAYLGLDV
ncbi:ABC transporter ATP-binding protein [Candidatus Uhrbacteria bacterium]|nr:ABC transporter ATP-binding protein [Candidatus Uhrbacteria bacterium]